MIAASHRVVAVVLLVLMTLAIGAARRPAAAVSSSCSNAATPHKVTVWPSNPHLSVALDITPTAQSATLCYSTSQDGQPSVAGGVIRFGTTNNGNPTALDTTVSLLCLSDSGTTGPQANCSTNASAFTPVPTVEQVDEPGPNDALLRFSWAFGVCAAGCTTYGGSFERTGLIVGLVAVEPGPAGTQGVTLRLLRTEVWIDGTIAMFWDSRTLFAAGVSNTDTPTINNTVAPAGSPCFLNNLVCAGVPTGTLSVDRYSTTVMLTVAGTSVPPTTVSTDPATSGGKTCVYSSGPSC